MNVLTSVSLIILPTKEELANYVARKTVNPLYLDIRAVNGKTIITALGHCGMNVNVFVSNFTKGQIDTKAALVQVIVWRHKSDKPLSEVSMADFTHVCRRH